MLLEKEQKKSKKKEKAIAPHRESGQMSSPSEASSFQA